MSAAAAGGPGRLDSAVPADRSPPCPVCGESLDGRPRAIYCCGACRAHASRVRNAIAAKHDPGRACAECGEPIAGLRSDARYCGTTCRVIAHKRRASASAQSRSRAE